MPTTSKQNKSSTFYLLKRSVSRFKPYKVKIAISLFAMVISGLCDAGAAWLVKPALDQIFIEKNSNALVLIPLFFIFITLAKVTTRTLQNYLMQSCSLKVLEILRDELYSKIIYLPLRFYEKSQVGMLMSRIINDVVAIRSSLPSVISMIRQIISMIALLAVVFYQNTELAIWAVIVLPLAFYPFIYFGKRLRKLGKKSYSRLADISILLQEILSGIRVVKAFGTEEKEGQRFDEKNKHLLSISLKQSLAGELSSSIMEIIGALSIGLVIWIGGMQVIEGVSTPGTFFSFVTALIMLYDPIKKLNTANNNIQAAVAGADRVFELLDDPELIIESGGALLVDSSFKELVFDHVTYAYRPGLTVLDDVSFSIKAGERIAIVGPSGAGKTTFVNLIPRFYDPQQGKILLNGVNLLDYSLPSLRQVISIVSQDNFLFNLSIYDNITYGMKDVSKEDVLGAAKSAFAHDFIMELPEGYDTVIGERGVSLSGGQKQRLTIARALVKNSPLLILDEATSALDSESELTVQKALDNLMLDRTSIVIAHRLSTIIHADTIIVMNKGKIVATGNHHDLLNKSPLYSNLYTMQFCLDGLE